MELSRANNLLKETFQRVQWLGKGHRKQLHARATALCSEANTPTYCGRRHYAGKIRGNIGLNYHDKKFGKEKMIALKYKDDRPFRIQLADAIDHWNENVSKFKEEKIAQLTESYNDVDLRHGDFEYFVRFDKDMVKKWYCTADSEIDEGYSRAEFIVSPSGKGLFRGHLNTRVPNDGQRMKAGFCNISSPQKIISFERERQYDWSMYSHLLMRIRGDGRNYMVNLQMGREMSNFWYDIYQYPLYTRGGPYWQNVKIPFSKFILSALGRLQDKQERLDLRQIKDFGITLADGFNGPFQLEIDYVALIYEEGMPANEFDYELYEKGFFEV